MTELAGQRWPELDAARPALLVVPLGATEQHGPHLPLATDTIIAAALAERLATAVGGDTIAVAPALPYGSSGEHQAFAGTISIGAAATELALVELCRSATETCERVLLLSAHGGNAAAVTAAVSLLRGEGRDVRAWSPGGVWRGDAHAGRIETSVMLALAPERVRSDAAIAGNVRPLPELLPILRDAGVAAVSANGVLGDPAGASAAEGEGLIAMAVDALTTFACEWIAGEPAVSAAASTAEDEW